MNPTDIRDPMSEELDSEGLALKSDAQETQFDDLTLSRTDFERSLTDQGLVSMTEIADLKAESGEVSFESTAKLARALVLCGKLTPYQARKLGQGRGEELILGNYVIMDKVGEGGMGQVFKARHRRMKRIVAIKMLPPAAVNSDAAVERFHREVEMTARLEHPNIVTAYDAGEAGGRHFLAMQYVESRDLASFVRSHGPLTIAQAISVLLQTARGLAYAHSQGIIHRDIKPRNLLVDRQGTLKILDLGLARIQVAVGQENLGGDLTVDGSVMGTIDYMAPEQAIDTHAADERADVYSLGCTLHYLLVGRVPFGGNTLMAKMLAHCDSPIPDLVAIRPDVPNCLDAIYRKMLAKKPAERQPSMTVLVAEIEKCMDLSQSLSFSPTWQNDIDRLDGSDHDTDPPREFCETTNCRLSETIEQPDLQAAVALQEEAVVEPQSALRKPPGQRVGTIVLGFLLGACILLGVIFRIQTNAGTIVVEIEDENVAAKLQKDRLVIEDSTSQRTWTLAPDKPQQLSTGSYRLNSPEGLMLIVMDDAGAEFRTQEFKISRGGKLTVRVTLEPALVAGGEEGVRPLDNSPASSLATTISLASPLDSLDPAKIPEAERVEYLPPETVGVLGTDARRMWGDFTWSLKGGLAFSPDSRWLAATNDLELVLLDAETLTTIARLPGHFLESNHGFEFSPDSQTLFVIGNLGLHAYSLANLPDFSDQFMSLAFVTMSLALSPDGKRLAVTGQGDKPIAIIDLTASDQPLIAEFANGEGGGMRCCRFSPDGRWLIAGQGENRYRFFRQQGDSYVEVTSKSVTTNFSHSPQIAFSFTSDRQVALLRGATDFQGFDLSGDEPKELNTPKELKNLFDIAFSSDGQHWAGTVHAHLGLAGELVIGDWLDSKFRVTSRHRVTDIGYVAFAPDGKTLATRNLDQLVRTWDLTQTPPVEIDPQSGANRFTAMSPTGDLAVGLGCTGELTLWGWSSGKPTIIATANTGEPIGSGAFSPDGRRLFTMSMPLYHTSMTTTVTIWDVNAAEIKQHAKFELGPERIWAQAIWQPGGDQLLVGNQMWDVSRQQQRPIAEFPDIPLTGGVGGISPDGKTLVVSTPQGIQVRSVDRPSETARFTAKSPGEVMSIAFSPVNQRVVITARGSYCAVWELSEDGLQEKHKLLPSPKFGYYPYHPTAAQFSPDGRRVIAGGWYAAQMWDLDTNEVTHSWSLPGGTWPSFTADGRHVFMANMNGTGYILRLDPD